jgi:hypothetical protein
MYTKLEINRHMTTFEEIEGIWEALPDGHRRNKVNALRCLWFQMDQGIGRKEFAAIHRISTRTLNRCIHLFNNWGLSGILHSPSGHPGPKRKVDLNEFHNRILPEAERAVQAAGNQVTEKAVFQSAQSLGIFNASYSTFLRYLETRRSIYQKPPGGIPRNRVNISQSNRSDAEDVWTGWAREEQRKWREFKKVAWRIQPELFAKFHWDK